jgi:hypothetical protein
MGSRVASRGHKHVHTLAYCVRCNMNEKQQHQATDPWLQGNFDRATASIGRFVFRF